MLIETGYECPHCKAWSAARVQFSAARHQVLEDTCDGCGRVNVLQVQLLDEKGTVRLDAATEEDASL